MPKEASDRHVPLIFTRGPELFLGRDWNCIIPHYILVPCRARILTDDKKKDRNILIDGGCFQGSEP
jgi:hypothetical protein